MKLFFLTIFLIIYSSAFTQIDDYQRDIVTYININGTRQQYENAGEQMYAILKKQVIKKEISDTDWEAFKQKGNDESMDGLILMLSFAYRNNFTHPEIIEMTNFYKTEAAQKLISDRTSLTEQDNKVIKEFNESDVAKKMDFKNEALSNDISKIYDDWKRELFSEKISELVKAGYTRPD